VGISGGKKMASANLFPTLPNTNITWAWKNGRRNNKIAGPQNSAIHKIYVNI
jgi:hypothetical protein